MTEALYTEKQLAEYLSLTTRALQKWRLIGGGPPYIRISSRCIRYRKQDVEQWINDRLKTSTSQP